MAVLTNEADFRNAIAASKPGDTIQVAAGDYHLKMAPRSIYDIKIPHSLSIIGVGGIAHFHADLVVGGKKKLVTKGIFQLHPKAKSVTFENIGFHSAHASSWNGAGIRASAGNITVRGCVFSKCDMGVLCMQKIVENRGVVKIEGSQFRDCGIPETHAHAMYVLANEFRVSNCQVIGTLVGHHVKSVSAKTVVEGCFLDDADGTSSYAVDISAGGDAIIRNNWMIQGEKGQNDKAISYMAKRFGGVPGKVIITANIITNGNGRPAASRVLKNTTSSQIQFSQNRLTGFLPDKLFLGPVKSSGNRLNGVLLPAMEQ